VIGIRRFPKENRPEAALQGDFFLKGILA